MAKHLQIGCEDKILGKTYTINSEKEPLFLISEFFL